MITRLVLSTMFKFLTKDIEMKRLLISIAILITLFVSTSKAEYFKDVIITSPAGIWTDERAYNTLSEAISAIGSAEQTLLISREVACDSLTIPTNIKLHFVKDGSINNSGTLILETKDITAGDHQIFTGSGPINFAKGSELRSTWFSDFSTAAIATTNEAVTLIISKDETVYTSCTIGDGVILKWDSPNTLSTASGITISNIGNIEAGKYQIFTGAGDFDFRQGSVLKSSWFSSLSAADTITDDDNVDLTIEIDRPETVSVSMTFDRYQGLKINKGCPITINNSVVLTQEGPFEAGRYKIFNYIGDGKVNFSNNNCTKVIFPEWWGAVADGFTESGAMINLAIESGLGATYYYTGPEISLSNGTYIIEETIILYNTLKLRGSGHELTILKLKDASNVDVIESYNFDALLGKNKWLVSDGVVHGFEISGFSIDGNKINQTISCNGINLYAKRFIASDILIHDVSGFGWFSEAGIIGGQVSWEDLPEAEIGPIFIKSSGKNNMSFRGPHDAHISAVYSADAGWYGVRFETDGITYSGSCNIDHVHSYSSGFDGITIDTIINADVIISESNYYNGIVFTEHSHDSMISTIQTYWNDRNNTGTYYGTRIEAMYVQIGKLFDHAANARGSLFVGSPYVTIGSVTLRGENSSGHAIECQASNFSLGGGLVTGYTGPGGIGLNIGAVTASDNLDITLNIENCASLFAPHNIGENNNFNLHLHSLTGQYYLAGDYPNSNNTENWNIFGYDDNTASYIRSHNKGKVTLPAGSTSVTVSHGLMVPPQAEDFKVTPNSSLGAATEYFVAEVLDTTFKIFVDTAPGVDIYFVWDAHL